MIWFERFIYALFPEFLVSGTPWYGIWKSKTCEEFAKVNRHVFWVVGLVYVGHYFFFDRPLGLQPESRWMTFRFGMAGISFLTSMFYFMPRLYRSTLYSLPMLITTALICISQAKVSVWYPPASYLFAVAFTYLSAVLLCSSIMKSTLFALIIYMIQVSILRETGLDSFMLFSTGVVLFCMVLFSRLSYLTEIKFFVANLENIDAQKKIIELNVGVTNQIKAFLPQEISRRLSHAMTEQKMSVIQATDEVLRPQKKNVACLFSDIRGFTQSSRDLDLFVNQGVFPNVKACTAAIDAVGGIPRKIGDLLFAYFDSDSLEVVVLNSIVAGLEIARINEQFALHNQSVAIERYVLISAGEAIVGNLGGFDSSIEITAIGSPVNYLSRLDGLTKDARLKNKINKTDLLLDKLTAEIVHKLIPTTEITELNLHNLGLSVRDFEEVSSIYVFPMNEKNTKQIMALHEYIEATIRRVA